MGISDWGWGYKRRHTVIRAIKWSIKYMYTPTCTRKYISSANMTRHGTAWHGMASCQNSHGMDSMDPLVEPASRAAARANRHLGQDDLIHPSESLDPLVSSLSNLSAVAFVPGFWYGASRGRLSLVDSKIRRDEASKPPLRLGCRRWSMIHCRGPGKGKDASLAAKKRNKSKPALIRTAASAWRCCIQLIHLIHVDGIESGSTEYRYRNYMLVDGAVHVHTCNGWMLGGMSWQGAAIYFYSMWQVPVKTSNLICLIQHIKTKTALEIKKSSWVPTSVSAAKLTKQPSASLLG